MTSSLKDPVVKTLNVNFFAAPGVGKSSVAAHLVSILKQRGIDVELVSEYAKDLHWEGSLQKTEQFVICAEQWRRQNLLQGKLDVVVTDSAVPLGLLYTPVEYRKPLSQVIGALTDSWTEFNVLLTRDVSKVFSVVGREHTAEQSVEKQKDLIGLMKDLGIQHHKESVDAETANRLADRICELLIDPALARSIEEVNHSAPKDGAWNRKEPG